MLRLHGPPMYVCAAVKMYGLFPFVLSPVPRYDSVLLTGAGKENFAIEVLKKTVGMRRSRVPDAFFRTEVAKFSPSLRSVIAFLYAVIGTRKACNL